MNITVYVEHDASGAKRASLEALSEARRLGGSITAVLVGPGGSDAAPAAAAHGADAIACYDDVCADGWSTDLASRAVAQAAEGADALLLSATSGGRDLAPRVAARLGVPMFSDVTRLEAGDDGWKAHRPVYAGKASLSVSGSGSPFIATLRPNVFAAEENAGAGTVEARTVDGAALATVADVKEPGERTLDVTEAPIVVSGGRGMGGPENWGLVLDLAEAFGNAAHGASRAVVDAGWRDHSEQVGQTGKTVAPTLYVACGISGAIQHLAGMRTSKHIVAINSDAEAPIFKVADYGIVGDVHEVLPVLAEAVRAARGA